MGGSFGHSAGAGELVFKWASGIHRAIRQEGIQADAGPFDLVDGRENGHSGLEVGGIGKKRNGFFEEESSERFRQDAVGLVGEIDEGFSLQIRNV